MKKLLATVTILTAVVSLTACGESLDLGDSTNSNLTAFELLSYSTEAQAGVTSIIMEMDFRRHFLISDGSTDDHSATMRMEIESEGKRRVDYEVAGVMSIVETIFLRDGYMYTERERSDSFDTPLRKRERVDAYGMMDIEGIDRYFDTSFITENMLESLSASRTDNGYRLEFAYNTEGIAAFISIVSGMDEGINSLYDSDISKILYIDENYLPIFTEISMSINYGGEQEELVTTMTAVQIGDVIIDFPYWVDDLKYGSTSEPEQETDSAHDNKIDPLGYNDFFGEYLQEIGHENLGFVNFPESWRYGLSIIGDENHIFSLTRIGFNIKMVIFEPDSGPASRWADFLYGSYTRRFGELIGRVETVRIGSHEAYRLMLFEEESDRYRITFVFDLPDNSIQQIELRGPLEEITEIEKLITSTFRR